MHTYLGPTATGEGVAKGAALLCYTKAQAPSRVYVGAQATTTLALQVPLCRRRSCEPHRNITAS